MARHVRLLWQLTEIKDIFVGFLQIQQCLIHGTQSKNGNILLTLLLTSGS